MSGRICSDCHEPHDESNFYDGSRRCKPCSIKRTAQSKAKYADPMIEWSPVAQRFLAIRFTTNPDEISRSLVDTGEQR